MASFDITYLVKMVMKPNEGSAIPIQDRQLVFSPNPWAEVSPYGDLAEIRQGTVFDQDKEDMWLFDLNIKIPPQDNASAMTITIGPYSFEYSWNWEFFRKVRDHHLRFEHLEFNNAEDNRRARDQWLVIRAPKMSNPAITISGSGNYAAVRKVALFVRRDAEKKHEFICVKTSDRLTGKFAERYAGQKWWYDQPWNHGVDVVGRAITLFPKQLFGTNGSRDLYRKFVTVDDDAKDHAVSDAHRKLARESNAGKGKSPLKPYMWLQEFDTVLYHSMTGEPSLTWAQMERSMQGESTNGFTWLVKAFGSIVKVVTSLLKVDVVGAFEGVVDVGDNLSNKANSSGFMTAVSDVVGPRTPLNLNTKNIPQLRDGSRSAKDFGID